MREDYLGLEGLQAAEASAAAQVLLNAHGFLSFEFGQYRVLKGNESFEQNYSSMIAGRIHSQYNTADAYLVFIPSLGENSNLLSMKILVNWGTGVYNQRFNTVEKKTIEEITLQYTTRVLQGQPRHLDAAESAGILKFKELLDGFDNKIQLSRLTFSGNGYALKSGNLSESEQLTPENISNNAHWTRENGAEYDLVFPQGSRIHLHPTFIAVDPSVDLTDRLKITINIELMSAEGKSSFTLPEVILESRDGLWKLPEGSTISFNIPEGVNYYELMSITWNMVFENSNSDAGMEVSASKLFTTLKMPILGNLGYITSVVPSALFFSCLKAKSSIKEEEVINAVWGPFVARKVFKNDFDYRQIMKTPKVVLTYYNADYPYPVSDFEIFNANNNDTDGECTAFSTMFTLVLRCQGISASNIQIMSNIEIESAPLLEGGFLVKEWEFFDKKSSDPGINEYPYTNFSYTSQSPYILAKKTTNNSNYIYKWHPHPLIPSDVVEKPGIPGQGNGNYGNPMSHFNWHMVVQLKKEGNDNFEIYDPSYGVHFHNGLDGYENSVISGFYFVDVFEFDEVKLNIDINQDGKKEVNVKWPIYRIRKNQKEIQDLVSKLYGN